VLKETERRGATMLARESLLVRRGVISLINFQTLIPDGHRRLRLLADDRNGRRPRSRLRRGSPAKITESPFKNEPALILEYCSKSMKERIRTVFKGVSAESFVHLTEVRFIFTPLVKKCCKVLFVHRRTVL
jgi:hypothetical protein